MIEYFLKGCKIGLAIFGGSFVFGLLVLAVVYAVSFASLWMERKKNNEE